MSARRCDSVRLPLLASGALQVYVSYEDETAQEAIVYVHGFGSTRTGQKSEALEHACALRGWTYASFDFRGHGQSSGTLVELRGSALLEDLEVMRDYLVGRAIPVFCPVGSSMGAWAAAWFALRHPRSVPGCALIAPAFNFLRNRWELLTESEREHWRETGRLRVQNQWVDTELGYGVVEEIDQFPVERLRAELTTPVLIFQGLKDDVVPYRETLAFVEHATAPNIEARLYKDGDHRLLAYSNVIAEGACDFFARCFADHRQRGDP